MLPAVKAGGGVGAASSTLGGHDSSKQQHKSDLEHPSNNVYSASGKTKKRDRSNHQSGDSSERSMKPDDAESKRTRRERNSTNTSNNGNKVEDITSFPNKNGGLCNLAGVDSLYSLVRHNDQTADRVRVAGVIAATDRDDCLNRFAQLGFLGLLNDWLQEAHRGKVGGDSAKESAEEGTEDLLLALLRALENLPVDLDSLKSCNAGRSVNNLSRHKSPEISKKAKKLVDLWKRKVESEIKPVTSNESTFVLKSSGGSLDGTARSSSRSAKGTINNNISSTTGEVPTKPIPVSLGKVSPLFSTTSAFIKENASNHIQGVSSSSAEVCNASIPDERSTSNQQPSCNGVAYSNGQSKSTCTVTNTKSGGSSRPAMAANGLLATGLNGTCKDIGPVKPLAWSWSAEISSNMSVESDKSQNESAKIDSVSNQKLIVRLPNPGRNPLPNTPAETGAPTNRSPPHGLDSFNGNSRSQPASCIEDALTSVTSKIGETSGLDQNKPVNLPERGIEEIGRQCRAGGEADCQSPESQLSFNSSGHCSTARFKETPLQSMEDIQEMLKQKSEQCNRQASDAGNIGICLLACVAADESSRSGKDLASALPMKNKNLKDGESIERSNTSGECTKPHQNSITEQVHGGADVTDAQEYLDCVKSVPACEVHSSEIAAVVVMGQADENTRAVEGYSVEHPSPSKAPGDDRLSSHSHTELLGSTLRKCHGEENDREQAFKMEPSLDDKKQVLHNSRNAENTFSSMIGSGKYEDRWRDEKVYASKSAIESKFRLPGEDALEVAVQVAKEVEQKYGKTALDKENPEASTSLENIVASKESQAAKEGKQNIIDHFNDVKKCDLYVRSQLEGNSTPVNSIACKTEGQAEKLDYKEIVPSTTSPSYKQNEHSTCSLQTFDSGPCEGKKLKFAEDDLQHGSPKTSTPEQTAEVSSSAVAEAPERLAFDLNEGIVLDESSQEPNAVYCPFSPIPIIPVASHSVVSSSLSTPKAVVASSKGAFVPPSSPFKARGEIGWRGSAATSAFRPAEPRKTPDRFQAAAGIDGKLLDTKQDGCQPTTETDSAGGPGTKVARPCLDFDLNVADEGILQEELACPAKLTTRSSSPPTPSNGQSGVKLYLDLNQVDESEETGPVYQTKPEVATVFGRSNDSSSGAKPIKHDFDLNDGLNTDDSVATNDSIVSRGNVRISGNQAPPFQGPKPGGETTNLSPWSHNVGPIPAIMPAFPSMRPETPFPVAIGQTFFNVGQGQGIPSYHADMFRPPAGFSSSTAAAFPYPAQSPVFPYTSYSFGYNSAPFPAPSASFMDSSASYPFPPGATQILASGAILPSPVRPSYMLGLPKVSTPSNNDRSWCRPSLDLNAGPEPAEVDIREDRASVRQFTFFDGPLFEQTGVICQPPVSADSLKRKEPEGGWNFCRSAPKQEARR